MANKPKHLKPTDESVALRKAEFEASEEYAMQHIKDEKALAEKKKAELFQSHALGLKTGRAQAFRATILIAEYLEWCQMADIVAGTQALERLGFSNIEEYFEAAGLSRSEGFRQLKVARNLSPNEVAFLGELGFTKKALLGYANIPADKRPRLVGGKLENYENADAEELKDILDSLIAENIKEKEELNKEKQAAQRVAKGLHQEIEKREKELRKLSSDAKKKGLSTEEDAFLQQMENLKTGFDGFYMLNVDPASIQIDRKTASKRIIASYISTLSYMRMQLNAAYDTAVETFGDPSMLPEEGWQPEVKHPLPAGDPSLSRRGAK